MDLKSSMNMDNNRFKFKVHSLQQGLDKIKDRE